MKKKRKKFVKFTKVLKNLERLIHETYFASCRKKNLLNAPYNDLHKLFARF